MVSMFDSIRFKIPLFLFAAAGVIGLRALFSKGPKHTSAIRRGTSELVALAYSYDSVIAADASVDHEEAYTELTAKFNIYVIVSDGRKDYMDNMISKVLQWSDVSYINAIDKNTLDEAQLVADEIIMKNVKNYKPGRVACVLSHKSAMEHFLNDDQAEHALILEDDVMLNPSLEHKPEVYVNKLMSLVPKDWNFINFGRCWDWCSSTTAIDDDGLLIDSQNPLCTHIYALSKDGARTILSDILPLKLLNIDQIIARKIRARELTGYASTLPIMLQNKKELGSLAAPSSQIPYNLCATMAQEVISKFYDGPWGAFLFSSDGLLASDSFLGSTQFLSSDGFLVSDGFMSSDSSIGNSIIAKIITYFSASENDGVGDLYVDQ